MEEETKPTEPAPAERPDEPGTARADASPDEPDRRAPAERSPAPWPPRPFLQPDARAAEPWRPPQRPAVVGPTPPPERPAVVGPTPPPERAAASPLTGSSAAADASTQVLRPPSSPTGLPPRREPWAPRPPAGAPQPAPSRASPAARPTPPPAAPVVSKRGAVTVRRLRRGRLAIRKIDPWAVLKFSFVFYFCMLLIVLLTVGIIFAALKAFGVIDNIEKLLRDLDFYVSITGGWLLRWLFLLGLAGTVVASAVTMFMAFLYNLIADVVGGIELLVTERE